MPEFDLKNIFGLQSLRVVQYGFDDEYPDVKTVEIPEQAAKGNQSQRLDTGTADSAVVNYLGQTVFADAVFQSLDDALSVQVLGILFDVRMTKNIDMVAVQGVSGTIKTYINDGDYDVRVRGWLDSENSEDYPQDKVKNLHSLLKRGEALKVVSDFLRLFEIYNLVVADYNFFQVEGIQNIQFFELSCVSDVTVELIDEETIQ